MGTIKTQFDDKALTAALENILATFTGDPELFIKFCLTLQQFERRARFGDVASQQVIDVVLHFNKLIEVTKEMTSFIEEKNA